MDARVLREEEEEEGGGGRTGGRTACKTECRDESDAEGEGEAPVQEIDQSMYDRGMESRRSEGASVSLPLTEGGGIRKKEVLLFDEVGSTYMCIINEGNEEILEYYRPQCRGDWQIVKRSEHPKATEHHEAGVPKTVPWAGPSLVVYTQGKQEIGKGGVYNKPTRKYYQWCSVCCGVSCAKAIMGCTKAKCWVAPRLDIHVIGRS
eukprot:760400-Hanusia_phi.AAC.10